MKATEKTGKLVAIKEVLEKDDIVVVTAQGVLIRQPAKMIRLAGRNTQGVRLIRLDAGDKIAAVAVVPSEDEEVVKSEAAKEMTPVPAEEKEESQGSLFEKKGSQKKSPPAAPAKKESGKKSKKGKK